MALALPTDVAGGIYTVFIRSMSLGSMEIPNVNQWNDEQIDH